MIRVEVRRAAADRSIVSFRVEGHADFAVAGKDIVCAGVSAVTVGTVNAIEALLDIELPCEMENGLLDVSVPAGIEANRYQQTQLLLESMVVMLQSIQESYGKYIRITEKA
ncbi:ribosomal-processing cysteine protease Prp [Paenibacillus sp. y28]|uniref:ribosomal-processing cysteine protease Prp n=1 Tax=Paenibacillus sp. y28 TaxID=3129110 RepID=UPI003016D5AB